jgi:hypothetical protein
VNLDVQCEGSPTAVSEGTGRDMICGAVLCSIQGSVHQRGVRGSGLRVTRVHFQYIHLFPPYTTIYIN